MQLKIYYFLIGYDFLVWGEWGEWDEGYFKSEDIVNFFVSILIIYFLLQLRYK